MFGRGGSLEFPFPVAAKTGTSQAYHDNWAIGYTRDVTVGVWVGNFDRRPLVGSSGVTGAGPLFHAVMLAAQARLGAVSSSEPDGIVQRPAGLASQVICELSGMPGGPACPLRRREWLPPAGDPPPCDWHHGAEEGLLTIYPPEYQMWARRQGLLDAGPLPGTGLVRTSGTPASAEIRRPQHRPRARGPEIGSPADGSTYLIDPTLRAEFQTLPLRAIAEGPIEWRVDGIRQAGATDNGEVHWPLRRGSHRIAVRDGRGREAEVTIVVK